MKYSILLLFSFISCIIKAQPTALDLIFSGYDQKVYYNLSEAIKNKNEVKILDLRGKNLESISDSISELQSLEELYLGFKQGMGYLKTNNLKEIPEAIFELSELRILQLSHNQIRKIPEDIKKLQKLEALNLSSNPLKSFPKVLYELPNLKRLMLSSTKIKLFPDDINRLYKLNHLDLRSSKAKQLPGSIGDLRELEWLDISLSDFESLPVSLGYCNNIKRLDLYGTHHLDLKETFEVLKNIDSLKWMHINRIKELPENISEFKSLETLFVDNDEYQIDYSKLFEVVSRIKTLKSLLIYKYTSGVWIVPNEIGLCTNLEELFLNSNYRKCIISTEIRKLKKLRDFSFIGEVNNFEEIKRLLPESCNIH